MGGKDIRKSRILIVLLLAVVFISGCAEDAQNNKTGSGDEEKATPVESATPSVTENVTESTGEDIGEGSMSGREETFLDEGKEVIIPGEENSEQGNETYYDNETLDSNQAVVQIAEGAGYTTFASLARDVGLDDTFNEGGPYTIFAPNDIAFESLPEGMLDDLRNDKERLSRVLINHVTSGEYRISDLKNMDSLDSLGAEKLVVDTTADGTIMVEDATIVEPDIIASNGIIHGIDKVLIPLEV